MTTDSAPVLVIDSDRKHLAWLARVVRTVVPTAQLASGLDSGGAVDGAELIVANYDGLDDGERERLFETVDRDPDGGPRLLLVSSIGYDFEALLRELERHRLTNLLAHEHEVTSAELIVTIQKILRRDIFGLDKYFGWGVELFTRRIHGSSEIAAVVEDAAGFATDLGVHPRLIENVATVVEELVSNAIYNAPVDGDGRPRFAHLPRTTPVVLQPDERVVMTMGSDGTSFGISVADSFGAMTKEQSLDYLVRTLRRDDDRPRANKGGAGLGLYMTLDSLNHLVLNICPGETTEVIGLIDIRGSYRDFVNRGKSFNIFLDKPRG